MRILSCIALVVLTWCVQPAAVSQTVCEGDCDGDGVVRIDELLRAVNVALGVQPLDACPPLDTSGNGMVEINELVAAVVRALLGCQLTGDAAAQASALIAQGIVESVTVLDFGAVGAGSGGGGAAALRAGAGALGQTVGPGRGAAATPCPAGGSFTETCVSEQGSSTVTTMFDVCRRRVSDLLVLSTDGRLRRTVSDAKFCDSRVIPANATVTDVYDRVTQRFLDNKDTVLAATGATLRRTFTPSGTGCAGQNGTDAIDGTIGSTCTAGTGNCPSQGRDLRVTAHTLTIRRASVPTPSGCERRQELTGDVASDDAVSGQHFDASYERFLIRRIVSGNGAAVSLDGRARIDCIGDVDYTTDVPLLEHVDDRCPDAGVLSVALPGDQRARIQFGPRDALAIDYQDDGRFDFTSKACEDPELARCP